MPQANSPLGHFAPYRGATLITAVVVLLVVPIRRAFTARDTAALCGHWFSRPTLALIIAAAYVAPLAVSLPDQVENDILRVGITRDDIALSGARAHNREGEITDSDIRTSLDLANSPQVASHPIGIVLWNEGPVNRDPLAFPATGQAVDRAAMALGTPTLIGYTSLNKRGHVRN